MSIFLKRFFIPRGVWIAVFVSLVLHFGGLFLVLKTAGLESLVYGDAEGYFELAKNIKDGAGFVTITNGVSVPEVFRAPGLPVLLSPFVGSDRWIVVYLFFQSLFASFFIPILIWKIASQFFGSRVGYFALWLAAIEPLFLFFSWFPLTEIPFVIASLIGIFFLERSWRLQYLLSASLAGLFIAFAVYLRPGNLLLFGATLSILLLYALIKERQRFVPVLFVALALFASLLPWYVRTLQITGEFALAGTGWRNVYTDYLASVRSLNNDTTFWDEKEKLKQEALPRFGLSRGDLGNPKYAHILRDAALSEIFASPGTVVKLQAMLYVSFFTNDGWLSYLNRLKIVPPTPFRQSATVAVLTRGVAGALDVLNDMKSQFFIPIIGRLYTIIIVLSAFAYVVITRKKSALLIGFILSLAATTSSVIGLGVEARLRISVLPFVLILAAGGLVGISNFLFGYSLKKTKKNNKAGAEENHAIKTFTVVVPTYNEASIINETIRELDRVLATVPGLEYKIVVADNGSTDGTASVARRSGVAAASVLLISGKGKGLAIREAARVSTSDAFAFCDADLSADPAVLPLMLEQIKKGADVVIGSRLLDEKKVSRGFFRTLSSRFFNLVRKIILGIKVTDSQCGLKVFHRDAIGIIRDSRESGWFLDMDILSGAERESFSIIEVPVKWTEFHYANRKSKLKVIRDGFGALRAMLRIRRRLTQRTDEVYPHTNFEKVDV